jgi:hypothetical protein
MSTNQWSLITDLPEPHQAVSVAFKWPSESRCIIEYIGPSLEALRDAGCITDEIYGQFTGARMRTAHTGNGDSCRKSRWYGAYGKRSPFWKITWHAGRERALKMPGVSESHAGSQWEPSALTQEAEAAMVQRARCGAKKKRTRKTASSRVESHNFIAGAPLLIRDDISIARFNYSILSAALEPLGLKGNLTSEGFFIAPLVGTSATRQ